MDIHRNHHRDRHRDRDRYRHRHRDRYRDRYRHRDQNKMTPEHEKPDEYQISTGYVAWVYKMAAGFAGIHLHAVTNGFVPVKRFRSRWRSRSR